MNDAILAMRRFTNVLAELAIDYYIGGSIASIVYGKARTTRDVDFVVTVEISAVAPLIRKWQPMFYADIVAARRSIATGECFNVLDLETVFQVDVFTPAPSEWLTEQMSRRQLETLTAGTDRIEVRGITSRIRENLRYSCGFQHYFRDGVQRFGRKKLFKECPHCEHVNARSAKHIENLTEHKSTCPLPD